MIFFVSFFIIFFIGTAIDLACGPEPDPYDYYISFFHNDLPKDKGYFPFYFNGYTILNGDPDDLEANNKTYEQNINAAEWAKYLHHDVKKKDVYKILYLLDRKTDSIWFRGYGSPNKLMPDSLSANSFVSALKKNKRAMAYFILAKKTERLVTVNDRWDPNKTWDRNDQHAAALNYLVFGGRTTDKFLKLRSYYQAQRLLHYGRFFKEASNVYDKYIKGCLSASAVKNWALGFKAGEEWQLGDSIQAARLYAKEFMMCPEKRIQAYYDFRDTKAPLAKIIRSTTGRAEKAVIYGMQGFNQPRVDLRPLQKVYQTDPASPLISVLLSREVNKLEEQYLTPRTNGRDYYENIGYYDHTKYDSVKHALIRYIPRLKAFCNQLAEEKKYPEPALGLIASAYLSWMTGDATRGLKVLSEIDNRHIRSKLYDEEHLVNLLLLSKTIKRLNDTTEHELSPSLRWLDAKVKREVLEKNDLSADRDSYDGRYYAASSRDFYKDVLAEIYLQQRDTAKAALCILKSERTIPYVNRWQNDPGLGFDLPQFWQTKLHAYHINKILKWDLVMGKSVYMNLLLAPLHQCREVTMNYEDTVGGQWKILTKYAVDKTPMCAIYEILGTTYLREHQYAKAAAALKNIPVRMLNTEVTAALEGRLTYVDPLSDQIDEHPHYQAVVNNKLIYALAMSRLKKQSEANSAEATYRMGNGLYNTSYYGDAWFYTAYSWSVYDTPKKEKNYYNGDYFNEKAAEKYFLKAVKQSRDAEFKARCVFMAAKCKQKQIPVPDDYEYYLAGRKYGLDESTKSSKDYGEKVANNPYFKILRDNYAKTEFYKTAQYECSIFKDFLTTNNGRSATQKIGR